VLTVSEQDPRCRRSPNVERQERSMQGSRGRPRSTADAQVKARQDGYETVDDDF